MARRYKLNQEGAEVQDLLDKIDSLKINESTEPSSVATELETLDIEGASYSVVSKKVNDLLNYYTKSETYSGAQIDSRLSDKADRTNVYTKQDIDIALAGKANIVDVPTKTSDLSNDSGFIAGQQVAEIYETKIDAASKQTALQAAINTKQDRINDLQTIREGAAAGSTAYQKPDSGIPASDLASGVIPDVSQFITKSVNDLVNYYTKSETYTKDEVATLIGAIQQFHYEIAASTSAVTNPQTNVLYLIGPTGSGEDKYEEYVYSNGWVKIGDTSIDLSGYVTTQALNTTLAGYVTSGALETALAGKADKSDTYTKQQVDNALARKTLVTIRQW